MPLCPTCSATTRTTSYGEWCDTCGGVRRVNGSFYVREAARVGDYKVLYDDSLAEYTAEIGDGLVVAGGLDYVASEVMNAANEKLAISSRKSSTASELRKVQRGLEINFVGRPERVSTRRRQPRRKDNDN